MNTNNQLPSDMDYFVFFNLASEAEEETLFDTLSKTYWCIAKKETKITGSRHLLFRLHWLGHWLSYRHGWNKINPALTPLNALHCTMMIRHNLVSSLVAHLSPEEMTDMLTEEWAEYKACPDAKDFLRKVEKRLDWLDCPFRGYH